MRFVWGMLARWQRHVYGARAVVLTYHRVAEPQSDPLGLCVSPAHFSEHLEVLRSLGAPRRLDGLPHALGHQGAAQSVCVTFDDGYADNLHTATPLLERFDVPATVFVVSGQHASHREFWWDEVGRLLLDADHLPAAPLPADLGDRNALGDAVRVDREALFASVHGRLYRMPPEERAAALERLRSWSGAPLAVRTTHATLSPEELQRLANHPLIDIGAHTATHPALDRLDRHRQRAEMEESKRHLEDAVGGPVTSFAYPHGRYTSQTVELAGAAGFERACTVVPGAASATTDPWLLPRVLVTDIDGDTLAKWLWRLFGQRPISARRV